MDPVVYRAVPGSTLRNGELTPMSLGLPGDLRPSVRIASILEDAGLGPEEVIQARLLSRTERGAKYAPVYVYAARISDIEEIGLSVQHRPSKSRGLAADDPRKLIGPSHAEIDG